MDQLFNQKSNNQLAFINSQLGSIKIELKFFVELPIEGVDEYELKALEKMYSLLPEKKTSIEISRVLNFTHFYHLQMMPDKADF